MHRPLDQKPNTSKFETSAAAVWSPLRRFMARAGATTTDMTTLQNATSDSCAFACPDTYTLSSKKTLPTWSYYSIAKKLGVTMRIDRER
jgi:hypothetical protein